MFKREILLLKVGNLQMSFFEAAKTENECFFPPKSWVGINQNTYEYLTILIQIRILLTRLISTCKVSFLLWTNSDLKNDRKMIISVFVNSIQLCSEKVGSAWTEMKHNDLILLNDSSDAISVLRVIYISVTCCAIVAKIAANPYLLWPLVRGAQCVTGENLKNVWAEFSFLS